MPVQVEDLQIAIPGAENPMVVTCTILVEGAEIDPTITISGIVIEREVGKIPAAVLTIMDGDVSTRDFAVSNMETFLPGKKIEIKLGYQADPDTVFKGIIVGHGNSIASRKSSLKITCRDEAVKMTSGRKNAHFSDMTDSDVAEQILGTYSGLAHEVESTSITHKNLAQYGMTDWDFLLHRFDLLGMFCTVEDGKVTFKKPDLGKDRLFDVVFGATLMDYSAQIDSRTQSGSVTASSWDYSTQEVNSSTGAEPSLQSAGNIPATDLATAAAFDADELKYTGKWTTEELQALADARLQKRRLAAIRGYVKFQGTPLIKPNEFITVGGIGERFSGPLYVSGVQHTYEGGDWLSEAKLGMEPTWYAERINPYHPTAAQGIVPAVQGLQIGVVTDIEDPEREFRVRVRIPAINGAEDGLWARVSTLDAGSDRGTFFRPEIGDEVIVGFLGDDPRQVVILGMLHSSARAAPLQPAAANDEKGYVSRSSFKMIFNDADKSLTIQSPGGKKFVIDDNAGSIKIEDENHNKITMDSSGITIEAAATLTLKAGSQLNIQGPSVGIKGDGEAKMEAASVSINGSGTTTIKGGMVQIN